MKIDSVHGYPYKIPMRNSFATAHGSSPVREGALVAIRTDDDLIGFGDIAPLAGFSHLTLLQTLDMLPALFARIHAMSVDEALAFLWQHVNAYPSPLVSGLELALLDVQGKAQKCPINRLLLAYSGRADTYAARERVDVNVVIGATTLDATVEEAVAATTQGFRCIKLKVRVDLASTQRSEHATIERVAAVRRALGPNIHLRLDANEGWSFKQAKTILHACEAFDIQYVEQPLSKHDIEGMAKLRGAVTIPIAADEAVSDLASARQIIRRGAADILIVKPQFSHGLRMAQQIIIEAAEQGVQCVVTSAIESGIGVAGALHLVAASPPVTLECGLATLLLLEDDLLMDVLPVDKGSMRVPDDSGLGVQVDMRAVKRYM